MKELEHPRALCLLVSEWTFSSSSVFFLRGPVALHVVPAQHPNPSASHAEAQGCAGALKGAIASSLVFG